MDTQGKLLIIDDELGTRNSLEKWLREEGYETGTAENASQAITRMAQGKWDIALLDIEMQGADGIELQRRLHELDPDLIVIMMAGDASPESAVAALKHGAYDYVSKPLNPHEIAHRVKKALSHRRAEKEIIRLRETVAEMTRPGDVPQCVGKSLDEIERVHILRILDECGGNQSRAAEILDIDRVTLHHKLKRYGWSRTSDSSKT